MDERGGVGIRLEPAPAIVRQCGERFRQGAAAPSDATVVETDEVSDRVSRPRRGIGNSVGRIGYSLLVWPPRAVCATRLGLTLDDDAG